MTRSAARALERRAVARVPAPTELAICWHRYEDGTVQVRGERWPIERWEAYRREVLATGGDVLEVRFVEPAG